MNEIENDISEMFKTYMYTKFNIQNDKESETNINTFITEQKVVSIFYDILETYYDSNKPSAGQT